MTGKRRAFACAVACLFFSQGLCVDCNAPFEVSNQQDTLGISECDSVQNITITPAASGDLSFQDLGRVNGTLDVQDNPALTSLSFSGKQDGAKYVGDIIISKLSKLESLSLSTAGVSKSWVLQDLPVLETLNAVELFTVNHLRLERLPRMKALVLEYRPRVGSTLVIRDVGLDSLDGLLGFVGSSTNVSIDGIPNVQNMTYWLDEVDNVTINGNGNLSIVFDCSRCGYMVEGDSRISAESFLISGCSSISRNHSDQGAFKELTFGTFNATQNNFTTLPIDFNSVSNLYIQDNPDLVSLTFNSNFSFFDWKNIVITGNPKLRLISSETPSQGPYAGHKVIDEPGTNWTWPTRSVRSMVFDGAFNDAFFEPFIARGNDSKTRPGVSEKFTVQSSLSLNCTGLNQLRKAGVLKGEYSCQGHTVPDESHARKASSWLGKTDAVVLTVVLLFLLEIF